MAFPIRKKKIISSLFLVFIIIVGGYHVYKPLPYGLSYLGEFKDVRDVSFLKDLSYRDDGNRSIYRHEIFDEIFRMIDVAHRFVILDMFLYNDFMKDENKYSIRSISKELTDHLIRKKKTDPGINIIFVTDPINTCYGGLVSEQISELERYGISVVVTQLDKLRDSNPIYSSLWRVFLGHFGNSENGFLPNPFGNGKVSIRSYLSLLNFKANHRKVIITDSTDGYKAMISSANPHDGSSLHSNVALQFGGPAVQDLIQSEMAVINFSGGPRIEIPEEKLSYSSKLKAKILTEGKIRKDIITSIDKTGKGDTIKMVMFYLSHRKIIRALKSASARGVDIQIILDPNKDAFGRKKNGIPNRQVARELVQSNIVVKWYDTQGEQCHSKLLFISYRNGAGILYLGSANFTRRNLNDFNLETTVCIKGDIKEKLFSEVADYFSLIWNNTQGKRFTVPFSVYNDDAIHKRILYFFMEYSGISTF